MNIEAMAREAGFSVRVDDHISYQPTFIYSSDLSALPIDDLLRKFAALVLAEHAPRIIEFARAEAMREAAGICEAQYLPGDEYDGRFSAAILAAIDQPKEK